MANRGRPPGFKMTEEHRAKIASSQILKRLIDFCEGSIDLEPHRASTCIAMLRKVMPDLSNVELTGEGGGALAIEFRTIYESKP